MAKVKLNPVLEKIQGHVGDLVFKRFGDEVVVSRKPDPSGMEPSQAQLAIRERFREAALYGKMAMADPATKALYEASAQDRRKPVFSLTVADFFNAPTVDEVDLSRYNGAVGDEIVIRASDDFEVASVSVNVSSADGTPIENGLAVETPVKSGRWVYTATAAVASGSTAWVTVTASDRPGGLGVVTAEKAV